MTKFRPSPKDMKKKAKESEDIPLDPEEVWYSLLMSLVDYCAKLC